jgi:uncharacterized membrane protein
LGDLPGGSFQSDALGVSADGSVVVGFSDSSSGIEAMRWTSGGGMESLHDILIAGGATGVTGWTLATAVAVSADGRTIVGYGGNALGKTEAWIATVPEPSTFVLGAMGIVGVIVVHRRRRSR